MPCPLGIFGQRSDEIAVRTNCAFIFSERNRCDCSGNFNIKPDCLFEILVCERMERIDEGRDWVDDGNVLMSLLAYDQAASL